jgi:tetratricopeptide (TPR) repeat protein
LPVDFAIEESADGTKTIWCGDHDPLCRMKGMHGVCLHPGRAYLELKVRLNNRTPFVQTFLWWANVATRVHEGYQSFFPPDVYYIADHARRSMSEYPLCQGRYYGINYRERARRGVPKAEIPSQFVPPHCLPLTAGEQSKSKLPCYAANDLSFYADIPVPTSYMCMESQEDFFGGYDYFAQAGIVHYANHHISPGKKQWTWGNHDFGYAWDRNLTDPDERGVFAPYIEIMAGVYTDNQPDFSFLQPGETRCWSQYWYPIQKIGPPQKANLAAAISLSPSDGQVRLGVAVTQAEPRAIVIVSAKGKQIARWQRDLSPSHPLTEALPLPKGVALAGLLISVKNRSGQELIEYQPKPRANRQVPAPATEPPPPQEIASADELYLTGLHLEQYRHATRSPTVYWQEALRRDGLDSRCNNAMGRWHLRRGEFALAEGHLRKAIARLTRRNPNPEDGEAYYNLGLCLTYVGREDEAYAAFYKAAWNQAWAGASYFALAELDCRRADWKAALEHLNITLRCNLDHSRARNLKVLVLRRLASIDPGASALADSLLRETLALDPLDWWARHLQGEDPRCDLQTRLDLAHDYAQAGFFADAIEVLTETNPNSRDLPDQSWGALPMLHYTLGWLQERAGNAPAAKREYARAAALPPDYCFPARLEEIAILDSAMRANPADARAPYYLGNLFYDRRRHEEAIRLWQRSARLDPAFSIVWRNLGIGCFNIRKNPRQARAAYEKAFRANPADARLLYERDQLWKRHGEKPAKRLRELERHLDLTRQRDDLSVELCALYNQTGQHQKAAELLAGRRFQPWEGGEGGPLGQHVRAQLALGQEALAVHDFAGARAHFDLAHNVPSNLSEARHLLANQSDVHYWRGRALAGLDDKAGARQARTAAATFEGDFQQMSVRAFSEMTFYSALAWQELGQPRKARQLFRQLLAFSGTLFKASAKMDYFATSLPAMLLFDDDLQARQQVTALFLQAQARLGLGEKAKAKSLLLTVLRRDPNHALAADFICQL